MKELKLILAAMLLLCLAPMPYGYYVLVRYVAMVAFGYMAYKYDEAKNAELTITFGALAVLFQPFIKIALGRTVWNVVDVVIAVLLVVLVVKDRQGNKKDK